MESGCARTKTRNMMKKKKARFTDNGDGTVTDSVTGLIWQQLDDGKKRTWEKAKKYAVSPARLAEIRAAVRPGMLVEISAENSGNLARMIFDVLAAYDVLAAQIAALHDAWGE